ncbi:MFS transporter [Sphingorhabdus sp. EL138]|uniref:spinster family MFS transporter n=1 Tax=Sphingorhabdus sp. EL138 TaxID=2073156 RepID=UPI000D68F795|nr:MFS transporter [Sphingorhabdus sp. EL138]
MSATQAQGSPTTNTGQAFGTSGYRNYVLFSLLVVYTLNFIDRALIGVISEPIIQEFQLTDLQFGLLSGFGFALTYTLFGIPIARFAEQYNRVRIIAFSVILWSVMTALCGLAGSFLALLVFRIGVGIGEAGCTPPANSIIADYFPPRSRARALAIYAMGVTLGSALAAAFGGPIAEAFSWREAFIILGLPGVVIGLIVLFTIKEPPRGYSDPPGTPQVEKLGFGETLKRLSGNRSYWINALAATIVAFVGYGVSSFQVSFFVRVHELSIADAALQLVLPVSLAAAAGTFGGGYAIEKLSGRFVNAVAWVPGWSLILSLPLYWIGFSTDSQATALVMLIVAAFLHYTYLGSQYTIAQGVVDVKARATAIAILLFVVNLIGYGLGPLFVGAISDYLSASYVSSNAALGSQMTLELCKGTDADILAAGSQAVLEACRQVTGEGVRDALRFTAMIYGLSGLAYLWLCKHLQKDLLAKMS